MKKLLKQNVNFLAVCLLEIIVGVLLVIDAKSFTSAVIVIGGIALMAAGLYSSVRYFKEDAATAAQGQLLMIGLLLLLFGAFCVFKSGWFVDTLRIFTAIYGVVILALGFCKAQISIDMFRLKIKRWYLFFVSAILSVACSLVVFFNPFGEDALDKLWIFTGAALLVLALLDVVCMFLVKHKPKQKISPETASETGSASEPDALPASESAKEE